MKKDKVICKCYNITVKKIIKAVEGGVTDWKELKKELKIATDCKKCKEHAKGVFKDILEEYK
ncbi:MAG: (2Fe-2S)-binding protein [Tyzzerella sp.]|uniref:(2Fe-2S)-binding protein n=1 Tax=Candidatus Fimicola merdigallinarum TaxID=2840819 RepID=A0A9D9DV78_9FIRM|nr:(2Fe-2S)-binding protein [Candidatus Fimicola merdigallinarum]